MITKWMFTVSQWFSGNCLQIPPLSRVEAVSWWHMLQLRYYYPLFWFFHPNCYTTASKTSSWIQTLWLQNHRPSTDGIPKHVLPLLRSCWAQQPMDRPEFEQITAYLSNILCTCTVQNVHTNFFDTEDLKPKITENPLDVAVVDNYLMENTKKSGKMSCIFKCFN